jgi:anthranilate 1,2-dioxygenase small subunit
MTAELYFRVVDLYAQYARAIDEGRFDDWLALFDEECAYHVTPQENIQRGLELAIVRCRSRAMLQDRIVSLQQANIFNIHTDRHLVTNVQVLTNKLGQLEAQADFVVFQTDQEGESRLFCVGRYRTVLRGDVTALKIGEQWVSLDTAAVPTLLAAPL